MPRSIWSGSIAFGLVNVPVRMFSAIEGRDLHFHFVHEPDLARIRYQKVCDKEGDPVPDGEIVRAYELDDGTLVPLADEDFEAAEGETTHTLDVSDFVPLDEIDPIYFERAFYLGPGEGGEKVYRLFARALEQSGLAAVGTFVMRGKQHLACLRVRDGVILLERMYFADEIRPEEDVGAGSARVDKRELEMALELIDRFTGPFEPEKYEDTYRTALLKVIRQKSRGKAVAPPEKKDAEEPIDLMAALRASLEGSKKGRSRSGGRRKRRTKKAA